MENCAMTAADLTPEQIAFRDHARSWLAANAPPPPPERLPITPIEVMTTGQRDYLQAWQKQCYDAGLVGAESMAASSVTSTGARVLTPSWSARG
jgi:hypothetical protein